MPNLSTDGQENATFGAKNTNPHATISKPDNRTPDNMSNRLMTTLDTFYRASHVLVDWVLLTWTWDVPPTWLGSKVAAVADHQPGELPKSKSIQPRSTRTRDTLYVSVIISNRNCTSVYYVPTCISYFGPYPSEKKQTSRVVVQF